MTDTLKPEPSECIRTDNTQNIQISGNTIAKYGIDTQDELKTKFQEIRTKHKLILPVVKNGTVSFSVEGTDPERHNYYYFKSSTHWEPWGGNETPESKAVINDLIQAGIITVDGKVNFEHRI